MDLIEGLGLYGGTCGEYPGDGRGRVEEELGVEDVLLFLTTWEISGSMSSLNWFRIYSLSFEFSDGPIGPSNPATDELLAESVNAHP